MPKTLRPKIPYCRNNSKIWSKKCINIDQMKAVVPLIWINAVVPPIWINAVVPLIWINDVVPLIWINAVCLKSREVSCSKLVPYSTTANVI